MLYAPTPDGQVPPRVFAVPNVTSDTLDVWDDARDAARQFWVRGSEDARLSDDVRAICGINAQLLATRSPKPDADAHRARLAANPPQADRAAEHHQARSP